MIAYLSVMIVRTYLLLAEILSLSVLGRGRPPQVSLCPHEQDFSVRLIGPQFRNPLTLHVVEADGVDDGEADHEAVGVFVAEGADLVEAFLAGSVPEEKGHILRGKKETKSVKNRPAAALAYVVTFFFKRKKANSKYS